jgi:hypothetical protein
MQPLQTLFKIPGVELKVNWDGSLDDLDYACIAQWLKQHGQLIRQFTAEVRVSSDRLKLRRFSEAAAACRSSDLTIRHEPHHLVDLADLQPVAGSLQRLTCKPDWDCGILRGTRALTTMSQLTTLQLDLEDLGNEEPWRALVKLTSLQQLSLTVHAIGDPSPLSALTGLTNLDLRSLSRAADVRTPFSFSSLQPLSTLQRLKMLRVGEHAYAATSLRGLAGLSNLQSLDIDAHDGTLVSLVGISPGVTELSISTASDPFSLSGIERCTDIEKLSLYSCVLSTLEPLKGLINMTEFKVCHCTLTSLAGLSSMALQSLCLSHCFALANLSGVELLSALKSLKVAYCGVTSLQPLSQLREGLQKLTVHYCTCVQEEVLELPHVQLTADVQVSCSNVKEVVLAGGVRRAVGPDKPR